MWFYCLYYTPSQFSSMPKLVKGENKLDGQVRSGFWCYISPVSLALSKRKLLYANLGS